MFHRCLHFRGTRHLMITKNAASILRSPVPNVNSTSVYGKYLFYGWRLCWKGIMNVVPVVVFTSISSLSLYSALAFAMRAFRFQESIVRRFIFILLKVQFSLWMPSLRILEIPNMRPTSDWGTSSRPSLSSRKPGKSRNLSAAPSFREDKGRAGGQWKFGRAAGVFGSAA